MENHNSILNTYYSKYKAGTNAVRFSRAISKLAPFGKEVLKDVVRELPGNLRDKIRDDIATEILQGKNPLETLSKSLIDRAYKEALNSGEYSKEDVINFFKPLGIKIPLYGKISNMHSPFTYTPKYDFSKYMNEVYYTDSSYEENDENRLRGGDSNRYYNKMLKYYNKLIYTIDS